MSTQTQACTVLLSLYSVRAWPQPVFCKSRGWHNALWITHTRPAQLQLRNVHVSLGGGHLVVHFATSNKRIWGTPLPRCTMVRRTTSPPFLLMLSGFFVALESPSYLGGPWDLKGCSRPRPPSSTIFVHSSKMPCKTTLAPQDPPNTKLPCGHSNTNLRQIDYDSSASMGEGSGTLTRREREASAGTSSSRWPGTESAAPGRALRRIALCRTPRKTPAPCSPEWPLQTCIARWCSTPCCGAPPREGLHAVSFTTLIAWR